MKKSFYQIIFSTSTFIALSCFQALHVSAGNYTWTGITNNDFSTGTNFNPNGVPSVNDTLTIVSATNSPVLSGNTSVQKFTMTSGTLNCGAFNFSVSADGTFNGGSINNGTLTCYGTSTLTFAGTTFGVVVNATGNSLIFNGSRFESTVYGCKKGSTNDNGNGNNYFTGAVTLVDSGTGNLVLSNNTSAPDTFNSTLSMAARSTGAIYIAHQGVGNLFNGDVTFSTGNIFSNTYGTAVYNENITLNSTSANITFGNSTGSCSIASGKAISIGTFSAGALTIRNFTQSDGSVNISMPLTGTATLAFGSGNTFHANLKASANKLKLEQSRFFGVDTFLYTGGPSTTSIGGNYFADTVYIANTGSSGNFYLGVNYTDTFATTATIATTSSGAMVMERSLFSGTTKFKNTFVASSATKVHALGCTFKGNLSLECNNAGYEFKAYGGQNCILDSTASISLVSGYKGLLLLKEFEQRGSNAITLDMTTSSNLNILEIGPGAIFNSNFTYIGQRLKLNGGTFNGNASFTRISTQLDVSDGGNVFNGATTFICDSVNATSADRVFKLANTNPDDFNGNVVFKQHGTGSHASTMKMYPAYTKNSTFAGNVTVDANSSTIEFGANGGKVIMDGSNAQTISKTGSYNPAIKKIELKKTGNYCTLNLPLSVSDSIIFTTGYLKTDSTNLLEFPRKVIH